MIRYIHSDNEQPLKKVLFNTIVFVKGRFFYEHNARW